jgi:DNA-binding transcriptional LysR family regulator
MDLNLLKTFRMVAATGNFTQAAAALNYAQSSVTAQIQTLEADLGVRLFTRLPRKAVLTEAGARLLPSAERLLLLAEQTRSVVHEAEIPAGTLTLGAPDTLCTHWLPKIFREYRRSHPQVRLVFRPTPVAELRRLVREGVLDVAFVLEEPIRGGALNVETLAVIPLWVLAPPGHRLTSARQVRAQDLHGESILLTELGCSYRNLFEHALIAAGAHPGPTLEFGAVETIKQCVMAGLGVTVLPSLAVAKEVAEGSLVVLPWAGGRLDVSNQMLWRPGSEAVPAVQAFLDLARQEARNSTPPPGKDLP